MRNKLIWWSGPLAVLLGVTVGSSQQKVPFEKGIPVAPTGLAARPRRASPDARVPLTATSP